MIEGNMKKKNLAESKNNFSLFLCPKVAGDLPKITSIKVTLGLNFMREA